MEKEKKLWKTEQMSGEVDINEDQSYDLLILDEEGCLNIGGLPDKGVSEIHIKIRELQVDKSMKCENPYELKFTVPPEGEMAITVEIENLQSSINVLSYARDGANGRNGSDGGTGACSSFGAGGSGGDGSDGEDGEDGKNCPTVNICYHSVNGSTIKHTCKLSKGGRGGLGGKGGKGGLCSDGVTYAPAGRDGRNGRDGRPGNAGCVIIVEKGEKK